MPQTLPAAHFSNVKAETPALDEVTSEYGRLEAAWEAAADAQARISVYTRWDELRRQLGTWEALTTLRFDQDTRNPVHKAAREFRDELSPKLTALENQMKRRLLSSPNRKDLEARIGGHAFALWDADLTAFSPAIEADLTEEARLGAQYVELIAGAQLALNGKTVNLAGVEPFAQSPDRDVRHRAQQTKWEYFTRHGSEFDRIYDELVTLRHSMARKLGFENFIGLGYKRMHRVDYDQRDVERYRDQVARDVVPLAIEIMQRRAKRLGLSALSFWDEQIFDPSGNPTPQGNHDWIVQRGLEVMSEMDPSLGEFYGMMVDKGLLDLVTRDGKAGGGYCTSFPNYGLPYIFANFNGTHGDVHVLIHEMGHAFQDWQSRALPAYDYLWPSSESAEIHSMSMEYLASPYVERFFGTDGARYREQQLADAILFLPYGVAIDHFQHLVYADPQASPQQRHAMWQQMEARYLPWRDYGDLSYLAKGGLWQAKEHTYRAPFYYIDYTLALCCALQFWIRSRQDFPKAMADYIALCRRGGEAAFRDLARSANLVSPFEDGALAAVVAEARAELVS